MLQISEADASRSLTKHRKIASSFRDTQLYEIFQLSSSLLRTALENKVGGSSIQFFLSLCQCYGSASVFLCRCCGTASFCCCSGSGSEFPFYADPHIGKSEFFIVTFTAMPIYINCIFLVIVMCHNLQYFGHYT
jgi:hypothetical protein